MSLAIAFNTGICFAEEIAPTNMEINRPSNCNYLSSEEIVAFSEAFPDAYIEKEYVDFGHTNISYQNGQLVADAELKQIQQELNEINNDPERLLEAKEHLVKGEQLIGVAEVTVYVQEESEVIDDEIICTSSKLMSREELLAEDFPLRVASRSDYVLFDDDNNTKYALTLNLNVYTGGTTSERYMLAGTARWQEGSTASSNRI